ncbi:MAG: ASCH domain-containing protein [Porticoccus sp.]|nr:ASCH domain-containing protein [Porticoccus sp.]
MNRALIVRQPWIDMILSGQKCWEMRSRPTNIRGRIGLIEQGTGLIVGEVDLIDSLDALTHLGRVCCFDYHRVDDPELLKKWKHPWLMQNARRYEKPIPYSHPKGAVTWVKI